MRCAQCGQVELGATHDCPKADYLPPDKFPRPGWEFKNLLEGETPKCFWDYVIPTCPKHGSDIRSCPIPDLDLEEQPQPETEGGDTSGEDTA